MGDGCRPCLGSGRPTVSQSISLIWSILLLWFFGLCECCAKSGEALGLSGWFIKEGRGELCKSKGWMDEIFLVFYFSALCLLSYHINHQIRKMRSGKIQ